MAKPSLHYPFKIASVGGSRLYSRRTTSYMIKAGVAVCLLLFVATFANGRGIDFDQLVASRR